MSSANNDEVISRASPHTIKKFELIETYVKTWAQKLLNNQYCNGLVFIDCMCNSGEYYDDNHKQVFGTAVRVSKVLREAAGQYPLMIFPMRKSAIWNSSLKKIKVISTFMQASETVMNC